MTPLAQAIVAYAVVTAAAGWLLVRWLRRRPAATCERCGPAPPRRPARGVRPRALRVLR